MTKPFSQQIADYAGIYQKRLRATTREAIQDTVDLASLTTDDGGRMPVVTSFLRASILAKVGSMPSGVSKPPKTDAEAGEAGAKVAGEAVSAALTMWDLEGEFYIGWSAAYARRIEYGFEGQDSLGRTYNQQGAGFLRGATEKWDVTVDAAAARMRLIIK